MDAERRGFLKGAVVAVNALIATLLGVPVLGYLLGPLFRKTESRWVEIGPLDRYAGETPKPAKAVYVSSEGYRDVEKTEKFWVSAQGEDVTVFSIKCTHLGCNVIWQNDTDSYFCPCHGAEFDRGGEVVKGPPPAPLIRIPAKVENGQVLVQV